MRDIKESDEIKREQDPQKGYTDCSSEQEKRKRQVTQAYPKSQDEMYFRIQCYWPKLKKISKKCKVIKGKHKQCQLGHKEIKEIQKILAKIFKKKPQPLCQKVQVLQENYLVFANHLFISQYGRALVAFISQYGRDLVAFMTDVMQVIVVSNKSGVILNCLRLQRYQRQNDKNYVYQTKIQLIQDQDQSMHRLRYDFCQSYLVGQTAFNKRLKKQFKKFWIFLDKLQKTNQNLDFTTILDKYRDNQNTQSTESHEQIEENTVNVHLDHQKIDYLSQLLTYWKLLVLFKEKIKYRHNYQRSLERFISKMTKIYEKKDIMLFGLYFLSKVCPQYENILQNITTIYTGKIWRNLNKTQLGKYIKDEIKRQIRSIQINNFLYYGKCTKIQLPQKLKKFINNLTKLLANCINPLFNFEHNQFRKQIQMIKNYNWQGQYTSYS